jgi:hypothetical protein
LGKTLITPFSTFTRDEAPKPRFAPKSDGTGSSFADDSTSHLVWRS